MDTFVAPVAEMISPLHGISPAPTLVKPRTSNYKRCRVCGNDGLLSYLNFDNQPLANAYRSPTTPISDEYRAPLRLLACMRCKLSQLSHVVSRDMLYTAYAYQSGVSAGWRKHCAELAQAYARPDAYTLDIASNDGTLVKAFAKRGCNAVGVEPSNANTEADYARVTGWWGTEFVEQQRLVSAMDIITAQNVLGHVDDAHDFVEAISLALAPAGTVIIEVPYLGNLIDNLAFDTIYHEHLSYWTVTALKQLAEAHGLVLNDIQDIDVHGGSMRAILRKSGKSSDRVTNALVSELHVMRKATYMAFSERVTRRIADINATLLQIRPFVGFGAPAKAAVMLGCMDPRAYPYEVYDSAPAKQGKLIPGTQIPIVAPPRNWRMAPGPVVLFAWNWASEIIPELRRQGYTGAIYVPLPKGRWDVVE